jgi:hypothetical protein
VQGKHPGGAGQASKRCRASIQEEQASHQGQQQEYDGQAADHEQEEAGHLSSIRRALDQNI